MPYLTTQWIFLIRERDRASHFQFVVSYYSRNSCTQINNSIIPNGRGPWLLCMEPWAAIRFHFLPKNLIPKWPISYSTWVINSFFWCLWSIIHLFPFSHKLENRVYASFIIFMQQMLVLWDCDQTVINTLAMRRELSFLATKILFFRAILAPCFSFCV